jgi:hypothetical protein
MSLKFGSGNNKKAQLKIVKQPAKKIRIDPQQSESVAEILEVPFARPHNYSSLSNLIGQFYEITSNIHLIDATDRNVSLLMCRRAELIEILAEQTPIMLTDMYMPNRENEAELLLFRPDVLAFEVLLALTYFCDSGKHNELAPTHLRQLEKMDIIDEDLAYTPFVSMTMREVFDCITLLQHSWKSLRYSTDLPLYLDALLLRISMLICGDPKPSELLGCDTYVTHVDGAPHLTRNFLFDVGWTFIDMFTDISIASFFSASVAALPFKITKADRAWLLGRAKTIERPEVYQTKVMEVVLKHHCFPGEIERFIRDHKSERFARTPRYKKVIAARSEEGKALARNLMEILNSKLPTDLLSGQFEKACRDEVLLMCLAHWIQRFMEVNFEKTFIRTTQHCRLNFEELNQLMRAHGYPVIVQSFNYYNVYYKEKLYPTNSVLKAFLLFLAFVMRDHNGKILNSSISGMNLKVRDMHTFWTL